MASIAVGVSLASGKVGVSGVAGSHGNLLHLVTPGLGANASQSNNWFGYNQGSQERGMKFHSIAGDWTVPSARQHSKGQAESSSTWIGIGGGRTDAKCTMGDNTLIQTGTDRTCPPLASRPFRLVGDHPGTVVDDTSVTVRPGETSRASPSPRRGPRCGTSASRT